MKSRLARVEGVVDQIDPAALTPERHEIYSSIQDFVAKAREALSARDLPRAQILADKASKLADDLAATVKPSR